MLVIDLALRLVHDNKGIVRSIWLINPIGMGRMTVNVTLVLQNNLQISIILVDFIPRSSKDGSRVCELLAVVGWVNVLRISFVSPPDALDSGTLMRVFVKILISETGTLRRIVILLELVWEIRCVVRGEMSMIWKVKIVEEIHSYDPSKADHSNKIGSAVINPDLNSDFQGFYW